MPPDTSSQVEHEPASPGGFSNYGFLASTLIVSGGLGGHIPSKLPGDVDTAGPEGRHQGFLFKLPVRSLSNRCLPSLGLYCCDETFQPP